MDVWQQKFGGLPDLPYTGLLSFAHLPYNECLKSQTETFDIAVIGAPFDTSVSYRPGARFGPDGIRRGSRRQRPSRSFSVPQGIDPYAGPFKIIDCGDIPVTGYDNALAFDQLETAYTALLHHGMNSTAPRQISARSLDKVEHPRLIAMGGDHAILLPHVRALSKIYGKIAVIHLDAHLDTWNPGGYQGSNSALSRTNHGTFFHIAHEEGILAPSIHLGIRTRLTDLGDYDHDATVGFQVISTDDLDDLGPDGFIKAVKERVGDYPVYVSLDIDVVDPSAAPATGTPEPGGWTSREIKKILRKFVGLNIVGMDLVEVSPAYDTQAEQTQMLAADLIFEFMALLTKTDKLKSLEHPKDEL